MEVFSEMFSWSEKNYETLNRKNKNSKLGNLKWNKTIFSRNDHFPGLKSFLVDLLLENDIAAVDQFKVNGKVDQIPVKKAPGRPRKAVAEHSNGFPCKGKSDIFCLIC